MFSMSVCGKVEILACMKVSENPECSGKLHEVSGKVQEKFRIMFGKG